MVANLSVIPWSLFWWFVLAFSALAGGGQHYPNGAEGFLCGIAPGPGAYMVNYTAWYNASRFNFDNGDEKDNLDFHVNILVDAPRFIFFPGKRILGGDYGFYFALPLYYADLKTSYSGLDLGSDHASGLADLVFSPLILGYHSKDQKKHLILGLDLYAPNGHYDPRHPATTIIARNHWTFEPNVAFSWIFLHGIDLSAKFLFDFHTENDDYLDMFGRQGTLRPGKEIHFDYALGIPLSEKIRIGLNGFYYQQIEDDELNGREIADQRGFTWALGPAFKYSSDKWALIFKHQVEISSRNRPLGSFSWMKFQLAF